MSAFRSFVRRVIPTSITDLYRRVRYGPVSNRPKLDPHKLDLIDRALRLGARDFADLGGMWRVNGGYAVYCAGNTQGRVTLVDFHATPEFRDEQRTHPNLHFLQRNFALRETALEIGPLDAVMLYDTLLHQVRPDWNEVLENYAPQTKYFLIYNQQYTGPRTVRLHEQGREWYLRHMPHTPGDTEEYADLFNRPDEPHPRYADGRTYKDMHDVWQWGITDNDLKSVLRQLGFRLHYEVDCGMWPGIEEIQNKAFIFELADEP